MWTKAGDLSNDKLVEYVQDLKPELRQLTIFPSELCNYRCKMCHIWGETGWALKEPKKVINEQLEIGVIKSFVEQILQVQRKFNVIITGGEPLLYKDFEELLLFLRSKKLMVYLNTNGSMLKKNIPLILDNIITVHISLDGPQEFHDLVRGKNSFDTICDNIEALLQEKKRLKRMFPYIYLNMVLLPSNYKSAKDFMKILRERFKDWNIVLQSSTSPWKKGSDMTVVFSPLLYTTRDRANKYISEMKEFLDCDVSPAWEGFVEDSIDLDAGLLKKELEELWSSEGIDYSNFINLQDYYTDIDQMFGRSKCLAPWHEITVRRNGDAYLCVDFPDYTIGNIYEASFKEIWEGERASRFRELLRKRNLMVCNRCCRIFADKESF